MNKKMQVGITGSQFTLDVFQQKLAGMAELKTLDGAAVLSELDLAIVTDAENQRQLLAELVVQNIPLLLGLKQKTLIDSLSGIERKDAQVAGFNAHPLFLETDSMECCSIEKDRQVKFDVLFESIGLKAIWVEDRVGFVSPRILLMIINEAYYTVQEGTAGKAEIDIAMKLGTAYPYGPFEACEKIGIKNVYETLSAIYEDTKDARYKICPMLKQEYFRMH
jgi:hypothetical protein